jgi:hypothetical protein
MKKFVNLSRMPPSGMLRREALVITDVSEELISSFRVIRIGELGTNLAMTTKSLVTMSSLRGKHCKI